MFPLITNPARVRDGPPKFYFFLVPHGETATASPYQHPAIALAEGFAALGIQFVSNIDHWTPAPGAAPLFRADGQVDPYSCSAVIFTSDWLEEERPIPPGVLEGSQRPITVYLDHEDGSRIHSLRPGFPDFDLVLRAHYGASTTYPRTFRPWAFGLTNRLIEATSRRTPPEPRLPRMLVSYRDSRFPHSVRRYTARTFLSRLAGRMEIWRYEPDVGDVWEEPLAKHLWRLTGRRHSSRYYAAVRQCAACACFGGYFIAALPRDERQLLARLMKRGITRLHLRTRRITQFDSWRFWESLAAGCATVHLDLERYGAVLPVMPQNWEHYIGLDLDHLEADIERMFGDSSLLERIGAAGQAWSIAHYAPLPTARRFLALIGVTTTAQSMATNPPEPGDASTRAAWPNRA